MATKILTEPIGIATAFTQPTEVEVENKDGEISKQEITIKDGLSSSAIRQAIFLQYGVDGSCTILNNNNYNKNYIDLGLKNEHRVTWLIIDVDNLLWNSRHIEGDHNIAKTEQYKLYNFKLVFKVNDNIYSFYIDKNHLYNNDFVFEVPRILTKEVTSNCEMILVIEENLNDNFNGETYQNNIPDNAVEVTTRDLDNDGTLDVEGDSNNSVKITYAQLNNEIVLVDEIGGDDEGDLGDDEGDLEDGEEGPESSEGDNPTQPITTTKQIVERFVSKSIQAKVSDSIYNGEGLEVENLLEATTVLDSLVKEVLWGTLDNDGNLGFTRYYGREYILETSLGQKLDSYVKYIRFAPEDLTQNIVNLKPYLFFRHQTGSGYEICYSPFKKIDDTEHSAYYDSEDFQYTIWIPARVYEFPGTWEIGVVAFAGTVPVKPTYSEWTEDQLSHEFETTIDDQYYCYVSNSTTMTVENNFLTEESFNNEKIWNKGYLEEVDEEEENLSLTKEYIYYDATKNNLIFDEQFLSIKGNELLVQTRNINPSEIEISHINGYEIVDKDCRDAIENLDISGVTGMGQAEFLGDFVDNELKFKKVSILPIAGERMYSITLIPDIDTPNSAVVKFFLDENYETEVKLATPNNEEITFGTLKQYFTSTINGTDRKFNFCGYFVEEDNEWALIASINGAVDNSSKLTELEEKINDRDWSGFFVTIKEVDNV